MSINFANMAQYYQLVQVANDESVNNPEIPQQVLLDDQIVLNDGSSTIYQNNGNNQYQTPRLQKIQCPVGESVNAQSGQHSQVVIQQRQQNIEHHQPVPQQQSDFRSQDTLLQISTNQESQQNHQNHQTHQTQQTQQTQHIYYNSEQILPPNTLVHHTTLAGQHHQKKSMPQYSSPHLMQAPQPHPQISNTNQSTVTPQHIQMQPQQQIVYRMQTTQQQSPIQQTQMLAANTHVIVQQPSGQQVLIPTHQQQDILIRSPMPQQRILYPRVVYSTQHQSSVMQPGQQHIQISSTPLNTQTNMVPSRISNEAAPAQVQSTQQHQNVSFLSIHTVPATPPVSKGNPQVPLSPQNQVSAPGNSTIRLTKLPSRGGGMVSSGHLYARVPAPQNIRPEVRPLMNTIGNSTTKAPRPRGALTAGASNRNRTPKQRAGVNMIVCRSPLINNTQQSSPNGSIIAHSSPNVSGQPTSKPQHTQSTEKQNVPKPAFRSLQTTVPTSQVVTEYSNAQLQIMQRPNAPKYRSPPMNVNSQNQTRLVSNTSNNTTSNPDLDLEDSIHAVVVKKEQQKQQTSPSGITSSQNTTLTGYASKEEDDNQAGRAPREGMTLAEYKKRNPTTVANRNTSSNRIPTTPSNKNSTTPVQGANIVKNTQKSQQHSSNTTVSQTPSSSVLQTSHNNYEIQTQHVLQNRSSQQMPEKDRNSAKMLVICVSGDQRLITFTLPRESCTVQDLLEQVGVPFNSSTTIQCVENPGANIDFVVTVGFSMQESPSELISRAEQTLQLNRQQEPNTSTSNENNVDKTEANTTAINNANLSTSSPKEDESAGSSSTKNSDTANVTSASTSTTTVSSTQKANIDELPRKIVPGFLAVCQYCGVSGDDHARCERCKTIFVEAPKRIPIKSPLSSGSSQSEISQLSKQPADLGEKKKDIGNKVVRGTNPTNGINRLKANVLPRIKSSRKKPETEVVILTLSSDEEDDEDSNLSTNPPTSSTNTDTEAIINLIKPLPFEPIVSDSEDPDISTDFKREDVTDLSNIPDPLRIVLHCTSVRIGLIKYCPDKPLVLTSRGVYIEAPLKTEPKTNFELHIHKKEAAKILGHFSPNAESIIVIYTNRGCGNYIKSAIKSDERDFKLSRASSLGPFDARRIILIFNLSCDKSRNTIRSILSPMEELSRTDKQMLLTQLSQYDQEQVTKSKNEDINNTLSSGNSQSANDIVQKLLVYPPGKGGIPITVDDYMCLATEQYLNDIIIDFYLKWVHNNIIPAEQREKTFIFSTFFYKRLTTMARGPHEKDSKQTAVQRRHSRVQNWTKNVNLFEKDFIIIPINEQSHWFLAIICFPHLKGPVTFDTNRPVELPQIKKPKNQKVALQIGNTTITPLSKRESSNSTPVAEKVGGADDGSERDEAEGEDSDLLSEDSNIESTSNNTASSNISNSNSSQQHVPAINSNTNSNNHNSSAKAEPIAIKQPLILIFDSLTGASRSRVVATLRNYLTCEYKAKMPDAPMYTFNKDNMPGHSVKVPQQNNFTDCGLYVLQYVEQFFLDPIRDYKLPIKQLSSWFDTLAVTRKREEIANLLQSLANENKSQKIVFPDIPFPTQNGVLIEQPEDYNVEFEEDEMDDEPIDETDTSCGDVDTSVETEDGNTKESASKLSSTSESNAKKFVFKRRLTVQTPSETSTSSTTSGTPARLNSLKIRKVE